MAINIDQQNEIQTPASGKLSVAGNLAITSVGSGLQVKEGSNAKMGQVTLSAGVGSVSTTAVTANSRIFYSYAGQVSTGVGNTAVLYIAPLPVVGTGFTIRSQNTSDTSVVNWMIVEAA